MPSLDSLSPQEVFTGLHPTHPLTQVLLPNLLPLDHAVSPERIRDMVSSMQTALQDIHRRVVDLSEARLQRNRRQQRRTVPIRFEREIQNYLCEAFMPFRTFLW